MTTMFLILHPYIFITISHFKYDSIGSCIFFLKFFNAEYVKKSGEFKIKFYGSHLIHVLQWFSGLEHLWNLGTLKTRNSNRKWTEGNFVKLKIFLVWNLIFVGNLHNFLRNLQNSSAKPSWSIRNHVIVNDA